MEINLPVTIGASKAYEFNTNDGKTIKMVELSCIANGLGIFKTSVKESLVPDFLEGKEVTALFEITVDRNFRLSLKLRGFS